MADKVAKMSQRIPRRLVQCVCIWYSLRLGKNAKDTAADIDRIFGTCSYKKSTVYKWHTAFRTERTKLGDILRPGAPQRARTRRRMRQCKVIVEDNRRIYIDQLSTRLGISHGSTFRLLHKDLNLKKRTAKLIPHSLTPEHKRKRHEFCQDFLRRVRLQPGFLNTLTTTDEAWFYLIEPRNKQENKQWLTAEDNHPQEPICPRNCKKLLLVPFFDRRGIVHMECLQNQTVKARNFLPLLQRARESLLMRRILMRRQPHRALLHMHNAPAHRAKPVKDWLVSTEWRQLPHPPYSPDLSPCDFFLFPLLKKRLRGREYGDLLRLTAAVNREVSEITLEQWRKCFLDWIWWCRKCLLFRGEYFEGMRYPPPQIQGAEEDIEHFLEQ